MEEAKTRRSCSANEEEEQLRFPCKIQFIISVHVHVMVVIVKLKESGRVWGSISKALITVH
jgi:hypothetical protein